jgi:hypothetical protein
MAPTISDGTESRPAPVPKTAEPFTGSVVLVSGYVPSGNSLVGRRPFRISTVELVRATSTFTLLNAARHKIIWDGEVDYGGRNGGGECSEGEYMGEHGEGLRARIKRVAL